MNSQYQNKETVLYAIYSRIKRQVVYIGISSNVKRRIKAHKRRSSNKLLAKAIKKYGIRNFVFEEIKTFASFHEAKRWERYAIYCATRVCGYKLYNLTRCGNGTLGFHHRIESKEKMSVARKNHPAPNKGKKHSKQAIERMRQAQLGKKHSEATKQKMRTSAKTRPTVSQETREKISQKNKGKKLWDKRRHPRLGKHLTQESKDKMSATKKTNKKSPWNKGLTKQTDDRIASYSLKLMKS